MATPDGIAVRVTAVTYEADAIHGIELRRPDGAALPDFTAGAHVDLHLPVGLVRSYSLIGPPEARDRYRIAVKRDAAGRGGSRFLHDVLRVGAMLTIGAPRNNFSLVED